MGLRETLNKNKTIAYALAVLMVVGGGLVFWRTKPTVGERLDKSFYSDDDGKTYFVDSIDTLCPFDHDGKKAVRAFVFSCPDGMKFVGYLERVNDRTLAQLTAKAGQPDPDGTLQSLTNTGREVKRPGDPRWVPADSVAAQAIMTGARCPDGTSKGLRGVVP